MIDIDVARRLQDAGLRWEPAEGDLFTIDNDHLRDQAFMLSSMVVERGLSRVGRPVLRFNGTTEWALDSVELDEAVWLPREDQLRAALGGTFRSLHLEDDGTFVVTLGEGGEAARHPADSEGAADREGSPGNPSASGTAPGREIRAPHAEDALAGALLVHLTR